MATNDIYVAYILCSRRRRQVLNSARGRPPPAAAQICLNEMTEAHNYSFDPGRGAPSQEEVYDYSFDVGGQFRSEFPPRYIILYAYAYVVFTHVRMMRHCTHAHRRSPSLHPPLHHCCGLAAACPLAVGTQ